MTSTSTTDGETKAANGKNDSRPLISDLLKKHAKVIAEHQEAIKNEPLYKANSDRYVDIFILRYVMTHKNKAKPATTAILKTLKYREEHKLNEQGDIRHRLYDHNKTPEENVDAFPIAKLYQTYCDENNDGVVHNFPDPDRGVITVVLPGHIDMVRLGKEFTTEQLAGVYLAANETIFQIMDEVTRRTGRLTKLLRVLDMEGVSLIGMDRNYIRADAAAAKLVEDLYPQLLGKVVVLNLPTVLNAVFALFRPLFPKRMVEKMDMLSVTKPSHVKRFEDYMHIHGESSPTVWRQEPRVAIALWWSAIYRAHTALLKSKLAIHVVLLGQQKVQVIQDPEELFVSGASTRLFCVAFYVALKILYMYFAGSVLCRVENTVL